MILSTSLGRKEGKPADDDRTVKRRRTLNSEAMVTELAVTFSILVTFPVKFAFAQTQCSRCSELESLSALWLKQNETDRNYCPRD